VLSVNIYMPLLRSGTFRKTSGYKHIAPPEQPQFAQQHNF